MNFTRTSSIFQKECTRFLRVYNQTILSPVVNALIFYLIFTIAFAGRVSGFQEVPYILIVATGLIAMSTLQASYFNTQSTISIAKMLGFIKDYTIAPLKPTEVFTGLMCASIIRALLVGILTFCVLMFFVQFPFTNIFISLFYILLGAIIFGEIGIIIGFASPDFDKAHAYSSYIITPLTMLSGTFYSATTLPKPWRSIVMYNPVFYIIDGFRYGMAGVGHTHINSFIFLMIFTIVLGIFAIKTLKTGLQG